MDKSIIHLDKKTGFRFIFRSWWVQSSWLFTQISAFTVKRTLDIIISVLLLVVLLPLLIMVTLLIKITDGGSILFWQIRVGKDGEKFLFPKFRSMRINAEELQNELFNLNVHKNNLTFKIKNDPRVTWVGYYLRKWSIDELPQLWCVIKGDMSLVGPRPPIPAEAAKYNHTERRRLDVLPGLTCIWQVSGRSDLPFAKQVELDMKYIEEQNLWLDIILLLKTIPAVFSGKGAY